MPQDHLAQSSPLPEHARLAAFAGEWNGEEMVYPSRWNEGGPATSRTVARMDLNGFYLIQDSVQMRDGKEIFATHGIFSYDLDDNSYSLKIQFSPDAEGWADVLTGVYRRIH